MRKDEDCAMDSGSDGQDSWCLELSLLQSGVLCLFCYLKAYLKEGNHMGLETVSECVLSVCLYRQSCNSNMSQICVPFAHLNGPLLFDP